MATKVGDDDDKDNDDEVVGTKDDKGSCRGSICVLSATVVIYIGINNTRGTRFSIREKETAKTNDGRHVIAIKEKDGPR